jgi:hypothetical protein
MLLAKRAWDVFGRSRQLLGRCALGYGAIRINRAERSPASFLRMHELLVNRLVAKELEESQNALNADNFDSNSEKSSISVCRHAGARFRNP